MSQMEKRRVERWWEKSESWGWFVHRWRRGVIWHWMRWRHKGCCVRYLFLFNITQSLIFLDYALPILWLGLTCQNTFLFCLSGFGFPIMNKYAKGGGTMVRDRGAGQDPIGCGRIRSRGLYGLFWGAMSCSPMSSIPPHPKNTTNPQHPPSPHCPHRSTRKLHLKLLLLQ